MWEHAADHPILFIVIQGKGWVRVDGQETEIQAGQAVLWPTDNMHKAWAKDGAFTAIALKYEDKQMWLIIAPLL